jgi:hypothetical protein
MRKSLGAKFNKLNIDDQYLPKYRNRQINYPKEFAESLEQAKKKHHPEIWLSVVWAKDNIGKTLRFMRNYLKSKLSKLAESEALWRKRDGRGPTDDADHKVYKIGEILQKRKLRVAT